MDRFHLNKPSHYFNSSDNIRSQLVHVRKIHLGYRCKYIPYVHIRIYIYVVASHFLLEGPTVSYRRDSQHFLYQPNTTIDTQKVHPTQKIVIDSFASLYQ